MMHLTGQATKKHFLKILVRAFAEKIETRGPVCHAAAQNVAAPVKLMPAVVMLDPAFDHRAGRQTPLIPAQRL